MKPSERDLAMAVKVTYAYEHGKPERPSLEHHIAEAIATARLEGVLAGIEAEQKRCIGVVEYSVNDARLLEKIVARIREGNEQHTNAEKVAEAVNDARETSVYATQMKRELDELHELVKRLLEKVAEGER